VLGKSTTWLVGLSLVASLLDLWTIASVLTPAAGFTGFVSASRYLYRELTDLRSPPEDADSDALSRPSSDPALESASAAR
jgi:hypothetical protein